MSKTAARRPARRGRFAAGLAASLAAVAGLAFAAQTAEARQLRYAFGLGDTYAFYPSLQKFSKTLGETADAPMRIFTSGSLLAMPETSNGLRDGLADSGFVVLPYAPAEFSEAILIANLSMLATLSGESDIPGAAMNGATLEYVLLNCPGCLAQFKAQNQVFIANASSGEYPLVCNQKINSLAELKGKRIRSGAGNFSRWATFVGASPVSLPGSEIYDALAQGVVDCTMTPMSDVLGNRYIDVVKAITLGAPGGVYSGLAIANLNRDVWLGFSARQREAVLKAAARFSADATIDYHEFDAKGIAAAKEKGIPLLDAAEELRAANAAFVEQDLRLIEAEMSEKYGVADAGAKIETAKKLIAKWQKLTAGIDPTDRDALSALYWSEVYGKLDPATYAAD